MIVKKEQERWHLHSTNCTVSVVIPVLNGERYIKQSVESVLNQTMKSFEIIIVDDGSSDQTVSIVKSLAIGDKRIRLVESERLGIVSQLNRGIELARGEYIARMDADDICEPLRFEMQVEFLKQRGDYVAVGCQLIVIDPDGDEICPLDRPITHEAINAMHLAGQGGAIMHPALMAKKAALIEIGGYLKQYEFAEDYDLLLRLGEVGKLANLPDRLLRYRRHMQMTSVVKVNQMQIARKSALASCCQRRGIAVPSESVQDGVIGEVSIEKTYWDWCRQSALHGNFRTSRKYALRLVRANPLDYRRLLLLAAACMGRPGQSLRRLIPFRVGQYQG